MSEMPTCSIEEIQAVFREEREETERRLAVLRDQIRWRRTATRQQIVERIMERQSE